MEHSPPPFFKTGPSPLARLLIFASLSLALLIADARFKYLEVLRQISRGLAKKEIAELLHISVKTVENHTHSLMTKLAIHDRVKLARFAIREGLAEA